MTNLTYVWGSPVFVHEKVPLRIHLSRINITLRVFPSRNCHQLLVQAGSSGLPGVVAPNSGEVLAVLRSRLTKVSHSSLDQFRYQQSWSDGSILVSKVIIFPGHVDFCRVPSRTNTDRTYEDTSIYNGRLNSSADPRQGGVPLCKSGVS